MLSTADVGQRERRRPPPSLRQLYQEYLLQRIEAYKNSLGRDELLRLGDEAIAELQAASEEQFVLTEVLMLESVDRLISKRLRLQSFTRWRRQHLTRRAAQRQPGHWDIPVAHPVVPLLPRIEAGDHVLIVGPGLERVAYLIAAHDAVVTYLAPDMGSVERLESRMAAESLCGDFVAYVTQLIWLPDFESIDLLAVDMAALADLDPSGREELVTQFQARTQPGGVHILVPGRPGVSPQMFARLYQDEWIPDQVSAPATTAPRGKPAQAWCKPPCPSDTVVLPANAS